MTLQETQHKARYGHKDWLYWRDRRGKYQAERKSPETMKRCLLDCGTTGFWCLVTANDGCPMKGFWALGINLLAHMKRGFY